jgi:hypothetical protein
MFQGCTGLISAPSLPATTLADRCYANMHSRTNVLPDCSHIDLNSRTVLASGGLKRLFAGTKVTDADLFNILPVADGKYYLPATALADKCYEEMFLGCTGLTTAPELSAISLGIGCCKGMFSGCTSLVNAPDLTRANVRSGCYCYMFGNCTSLTIAPELPAILTTGDTECYYGMFEGCTSLTVAPELPSPTLALACYSRMFYRCSLINHIKCLATNISAFNCTTNWVYGVSSSGTFEKNQNMSSWTTGVNGIPANWTVTDAS